MKEYVSYTLLAIVIAFGGLGCAGKSSPAKKVILQHPQTMEFAKCNVGQWGSESPFDSNEECIEDYKKQGYVVWGEH